MPATTTSTTTTSTSTTTTTLPAPRPTLTPTVTVKSTPTPPICELTSMTVSKNALKLKGKQNYDVTVKLTGDNDCPVESMEITVKINKAGKKCITVTPVSAATDANGEVTFTVKARKVAGRAKVTFGAGSLRKDLIVKVKK